MLKLPSWVYKCLETYGNCALPNECMKMNKYSLEGHLTMKMGRKIKIRTAIYHDHSMKDGKVDEPYWIAEEK